MRHSVLSLVLAGSLLAAGCGHKTSSGQTLRTCVDRWNQGNMIAWGPVPANVAFRRPVAKEHASIELSSRRRCIVAIAAGGGTWTCVLGSSGAYSCPPLHEPTGPQLRRNARIGRRGVLVLDQPPRGTHPTRPLAWQRYPHVDGFVEPWTGGGTLRPGLRFKGEGRGACVVVDETALFAISCLTPDSRRYEACFPQRQDWRAGDLAGVRRARRYQLRALDDHRSERRHSRFAHVRRPLEPGEHARLGTHAGKRRSGAPSCRGRRRLTLRRHARRQLQAADGEPLLRPSRSRSFGLLLPSLADVCLRDERFRGVRVPDECGRLAAAEESERDNR